MPRPSEDGTRRTVVNWVELGPRREDGDCQEHLQPTPLREMWLGHAVLLGFSTPCWFQGSSSRWKAGQGHQAYNGCKNLPAINQSDMLKC